MKKRLTQSISRTGTSPPSGLQDPWALRRLKVAFSAVGGGTALLLWLAQTQELQALLQYAGAVAAFGAARLLAHCPLCCKH